VQHLDCLTDEEKEVFKTFAEIPQMAIINQAAQRQKHIDQAQSLNVSIDPSEVSVKEINQLYIEAWKKGVKSLYYQNSVNAAQKFSRDILECKACES
jgi:ribonucleoside-diphosphate reductase alpha chain